MGKRERVPGLVRWGAVIVWASVIFYASSIPGSQIPGKFGSLAHFVEYAILGALLYGALILSKQQRTALLLSIVLASAYGVTDELHQLFVPQRVADPIDWLVDTAGAAAGAGATMAIDRMRALRKRQ